MGSGTDLVYAATTGAPGPGTDPAYAAASFSALVAPSLGCYARATRCPVLTRRMLLPGSKKLATALQSAGSTATRMVLRTPNGMPGTDRAYAATRLLAYQPRPQQVRYGLAGILLRPPYALSGPGIRIKCTPPTRCAVLGQLPPTRCLVPGYALPTQCSVLRYARPTRCPVLS
eukprot:3280437-Rhodomonas_salina.2